MVLSTVMLPSGVTGQDEWECMNCGHTCAVVVKREAKELKYVPDQEIIRIKKLYQQGISANEIYHHHNPMRFGGNTILRVVSQKGTYSN
jgi:hypothetical protein